MFYSAIHKLGDKILYSARPPICDDIAGWARDRGMPVWLLHPPIAGDLFSLTSLSPVVKQEHEKFKRVLERPQSLVVVQKAVVRDASGQIRLPDGRFCLEGNWRREYLEECRAYRRALPWRRRHLKGDVYPLFSHWSPAYYHWLHDVLPRLHTSLPYLPLNTRFLINEGIQSYQIESLRAYGISENRLVIQPAGQDTLVERLWFATPLGYCDCSSGSILSEVGHKLRQHYQSGTRFPHRKLYISRAKASIRRIRNEGSILSALREAGFEIVCAEDLSWPEQVRLFVDSGVIVGPHGAGLSNMLFPDATCTVVELTHEKTKRNCFATMAAQLGHRFIRIYLPPLKYEDDADLEMTPEGLAQLLAIKMDIHETRQH